MSQDHAIRIEGRIEAVFAHRFVIARADATKVLADLGPKGADAFTLEVGAHVVAEGEMKPSELKVATIALEGQAPIAIAHGKKHDHDKHDFEKEDLDGHGDPREAKLAVEKAGWKVVGEPRRKPRHFEVLARRGDTLVECHVEFDGSIRKEKPIAIDSDKWLRELTAAV